MKTFIDDYRELYGGEPTCKVLPIAPSSYYQHAARRDDVLSERIRRLWEENFRV